MITNDAFHMNNLSRNMNNFKLNLDITKDNILKTKEKCIPRSSWADKTKSYPSNASRQLLLYVFSMCSHKSVWTYRDKRKCEVFL